VIKYHDENKKAAGFQDKCTNLLDNKSSYIMADEDQWSRGVSYSLLHEKAEKTVGMFSKLGVFIIHGEAVIIREEHDPALLVKAAGENISGPILVLVGPSVSVDKIAGLDVETVNSDDTGDGTKNRGVSDSAMYDEKGETKQHKSTSQIL
jgi:hypothetical protein